MKDYLKKELENPSFPFFLSVSLGLHICLLVFFLVSGSFRDLFRSKAEVVTPVSIRVDSIGLPELQAAVRKARAKQPKTVLIPKKEKKKKPKPKKKEIKKPKPKKKPKPEKSPPKEDSKKPPDLDDKIQNSPPDTQNLNTGNRLSEGADQGQETLSPQQISEISLYLDLVLRRIKSQWNLPKYLIDKDFKAQIEIRINDAGKVIFKEIVTSSGDDLFDGWALKALERASPYPPPPVTVRQKIRNGIVFTLSSQN